ncbi:MAG: DUF1127 domain-containing protein [Acidiferrobacterales bacterium]
MNDYAYHLWSRIGGDRFNRGLEWGTYPRTAELLKRLLAAYKNSRKRALAIGELERLGDRELADIGIRRDQIREVVYGLTARHESERKETKTATAPVGSTAHPASC